MLMKHYVDDRITKYDDIFEDDESKAEVIVDHDFHVFKLNMCLS